MTITSAPTSFFLLAILLLPGLFSLELIRRSRVQTKLNTRVSEQTAELTRSNEELKLRAASLRAELDERQLMDSEMAKVHQELLAVTRKAGMSEVATGVLHNVGNVLNSVNVSACLLTNHLRRSKMEYLASAMQLFKKHRLDLGNFLMNDEKGKKLPEYLDELVKHLDGEQRLLIREADSIRSKIEHIKEIVATQQSYGRVSGVAERICVTKLMDDVLQINATELAEQKIQVHREYAPRLPEIIVDKHKVLQILLNVLSNAKHACVDSAQDDKRVTVTITIDSDKVKISIHDNGVGIPAANLNKIFNHGFTTRIKNGHGFGLHSGALAASEIRGQLTAHSDGPNTGATFTLELPLKPS
jgi:two-component system NtrC family sensor kinase